MLVVVVLETGGNILCEPTKNYCANKKQAKLYIGHVLSILLELTLLNPHMR
jgi:hypothetical protein